MDTAQWPQEILVKPIEEMIPNNTRSSSVVTASANNTTTCSNLISNNNSISKAPSTSLERKVRPQKDHAVNCPRCNSTNTKFCYYNNYSLTQPRYFCKTCRRYWTEGGSLRNIPVGGGSRKNKRSSSSSSSSSANSASKKLSSHDLVHQHHHHNAQNPKMNYHHQGHDLNLGFAPTHQQQQQQHEFRSLSEFMQLPTIDNTPKSHIPNSTGADNANSASGNNGNNHNHHHHHQQLSALELLNGLTSSRGLTPFMPMPVPVPDPNGVYSSGFPPMHDFKPSLNFSLVDGLGNGYGSLQQEVHQQATDEQQQPNNSGRLLFPFEDLKQVSSTTSADHNNSNNNNNNNNNNNTNTNNNSADNHDQNGEQGDSTPGYWSGMLGNGGSW